MPRKRKLSSSENAAAKGSSKARRPLTPPFQPPPPPPKKSSKSRTTKPSSPQKTDPQNQSPFFRLPREIRDLIYDEIFIFPTTIHLAYVGGRTRKFRSFLCKVPEENQLERTREGTLCYRCRGVLRHPQCSPRDSKQGWIVRVSPTKDERRDVRAVAMLRSCRRVYTETIDKLYARNAFYIENPRTLLELPTYVPQTRLSSFRTLCLESPVYTNAVSMTSNPIPKWKEVIKALEKLDGLADLCVILRPVYGFEGEIDELWDPLKAAKLPAGCGGIECWCVVDVMHVVVFLALAVKIVH
ncbi:hypothetical protein BJY01DRAFT_261641 [Aspergillus pseudoustus]|uniref:DUF7730 domain-containing protein n=1 Tax=Aspergillus pseudoustus TaxID=1810923 RepID=A0ABR4IJY6_9EURO